MLRAFLLSILLAACGGAPRSSVGSGEAARVLVDVDEQGVGLHGHDPVAYASEGKPVPGDAAHAWSHGGANYWFSSEANRATFGKDPARHAPRFGGYCAFAASQNRVSPADPTSWEIVDGQLLMFTNADFKEQFAADPKGNLAKAEKNWPGLVERHGR